MAIEDFGTYTEVDPNSRITVATRRVAWTDLARNESAYVYFDKTADFFDGDFVHEITVNITSGDQSSSLFSALWMLANSVASYDDIRTNGQALALAFFYSGSTPTLRLIESENNSHPESSTFTITLGTPYYLKIVRDESAGANGTLYCYIYTDAARTTLTATLSRTLTVNRDFRYIYSIASYNTSNANKHTGYTENLEIFTSLSTALKVTTLGTSAMMGTTFTGHGVIDNLGLSSVTAHGIAWNTSIDPLTSDNSVDDGAGSLGAFDTDATGTIEGQVYFMRAWATNTEGTVYGGNIKFIAGIQGSLLRPYEITVKGENLHYVSHSGIERSVTGSPV